MPKMNVPNERTPLKRSNSQRLISDFGSMIWTVVKKKENQEIAKDVAWNVGSAAWSVAKDEENRTMAKMVTKTASRAAWNEVKKEKNQKFAVDIAKRGSVAAWSFAFPSRCTPVVPPI